jgi:Reverse transcriptase (RNA-dependent DNA polymerase)
MSSLVILFSYIFIKIIVQSSVFIKYSDSTTTIIFVYVDDNIITENNEKKIINIKDYLKNKFDIEDLRKLKYFF